MKLLPALIDRDIQDFGEALTQIQAAVGDSFSSVQGGRFANKTAEEGTEFLKKQGAFGTGQSSWGPAFYGLFQKEEAEKANKSSS
jgi:beta-ribofuranosylaminobenzene 5'-phosphate synthase